MSAFLKVEEFIDEVRDRWGDTDCDADDRVIITYLNSALRKLAMEPGMDKLFVFKDTFELASINKDGSKAATWTLDGTREDSEDTKCVGSIIDVKNFQLADGQSCALPNITPCYQDPTDFNICNINPEANTPGNPGNFTIMNYGGIHKLIFDRPIDGVKNLDIVYSAFHPRLRNEQDLIRVHWAYLDPIIDHVVIMLHKEGADLNSARAEYEDYDVLVDLLRELLSRNPSAAPFRRLRRSF